MTLNEWVASVGGFKRAREILRVEVRTLRSWLRLERAPELGAAAQIVMRTGGKVDYNGLYAPIVANRLEVGK